VWVHGCVLAQHPHSNVDSRVLINAHRGRPTDRRSTTMAGKVNRWKGRGESLDELETDSEWPLHAAVGTGTVDLATVRGQHNKCRSAPAFLCCCRSLHPLAHVRPFPSTTQHEHDSHPFLTCLSRQVRKLLDGHADPNAVDALGRTPLAKVRHHPLAERRDAFGLGPLADPEGHHLVYRCSTTHMNAHRSCAALLVALLHTLMRTLHATSLDC
jgi:hypothetical protein